MPISDTARRIHEELFPGHVSTLAQTDPELIEVFDNFAFDEVLRDTDDDRLDTRTRLMTQLAALIASHAVAEYRAILGAALTAGVTPVEAKEIVYQAVPYVGMAKVFDVLHVTNEVLEARGVTFPFLGRPQRLRKPGPSVGLPCSVRSSGRLGWTPCTPARRKTSCTSSDVCRRTASAITSPAVASTSRLVSC
jgi:alkylhydroperoxidase/carboxymuconolactone decarboxylase family protein YurZ